jgi:hypothetical protein
LVTAFLALQQKLQILEVYDLSSPVPVLGRDARLIVSPLVMAKSIKVSADPEEIKVYE